MSKPENRELLKENDGDDFANAFVNHIAVLNEVELQGNAVATEEEVESIHHLVEVLSLIAERGE